MGTGLKELKLWQEAVALAADALRIGRGAAKRETRVVTDRLMTTATDVAARIAAGYTHESPATQLEFYIRARESLVELETVLAAGRLSALLPTDAVLAASARAGSVHRLLAGYVAYVGRQLGEAPRSGAGASPAPAASSTAA
jgi:four helix bundle protein